MIEAFLAMGEQIIVRYYETNHWDQILTASVTLGGYMLGSVAVYWWLFKRKGHQ